MKYYTVEYDGYTYKREEKKEKESTLGANNLIQALSLPSNDTVELLRIISKMNSKSKWKDITDKQERVYTKMDKILSKLKAYTPFSVPFLSKVSKREAPEYYTLIENPMDLSKMGKKLFLQEYSDIGEFCNDLNLIWENCFKFNHTHGNVYAMYAQKMKEKSLFLLQELFSEREIKINEPEEEVRHFLDSEKYRKEMATTRAAILQNPSEFTFRRTPQKMHDFWEREREAMEKPENEYFLHIPEYMHFYNSFPVTREGQSHGLGESSECTFGEIFPPEAVAASGAALKEKKSNNSPKVVTYRDGKYFSEGNVCENLAVGRSEVFHLMRKVVSLQLLSVGFTGAEGSALGVLVSYGVLKMEEVLLSLKDLSRKVPENMNACEYLTRSILSKLNILEEEPIRKEFFSDDDDDTEEDSIIDMIYSNPEEIEVDDEM
ncbi:uncharacterized protein NEMAJ01_0656 [Nematocida major]|uniref:uncharacterized protein n=1 Tax=Nematocida major TaxID=1912982 RepID=UPI00200770D5|nr:uncharacterized protein NEMAJ01_0656 [Nematocida major]KAH9385760.1 hypothetical protein NEMAJ01_0656 [Nematocida major]